MRLYLPFGNDMCRQTDNDGIHAAVSDGFIDCAQRDRLAIAGGDLVAEVPLNPQS